MRDAVTARIDYIWDKSIEIGEFCVAHVWFQCFEKDTPKIAQNPALDTNSNPNADSTPTHINFVWKKSGFFLSKKMVGHTESHLIKSCPISILLS